MSWRIRVWCADCYGEDQQGCFDGGAEVAEQVYGFREAAEVAAEEWAAAPWRAIVFYEGRSRAYPWWRHMDPQNGLLALARVGAAVAVALAAAKLHDFAPDPFEPWWHVYPMPDPAEDVLSEARLRRREFVGDWAPTSHLFSYGDLV